MRPTPTPLVRIKPLRLSDPSSLRLPPALTRAAAGPSGEAGLKHPIPSSSLAAALPSHVQQSIKGRLTLADELALRQERGLQARARRERGEKWPAGTEGAEEEVTEVQAEEEDWPRNLHVEKFVHGKERYWNVSCGRSRRQSQGTSKWVRCGCSPCVLRTDSPIATAAGIERKARGTQEALPGGIGRSHLTTYRAPRHTTPRRGAAPLETAQHLLRFPWGFAQSNFRSSL